MDKQEEYRIKGAAIAVMSIYHLTFQGVTPSTMAASEFIEQALLMWLPLAPQPHCHRALLEPELLTCGLVS